ncbi:5-oxoprolinase subunit PxpB [Robiginitalea sp. SC105]|uniref:5-oxoprolinase subunit PxpB n=1 Tax=Robiginitalea sp. SC105 TaxID=2762332 RepID=UPI00163B2192|nr:5-oxoprolinase subunit PxpB [Robiginitalea sp. SC105]
MKVPPFQVKAFGPEAVLLEWPAAVREDILTEILGFRDYLIGDCLEGTTWELVAIYNSLMLYKGKPIDMEPFERQLREWFDSYPGPATLSFQEWELPVCYEGEFAPDLGEVAARLGTTAEEVVRRHCGTSYRVYGIGFLPGFLYLGGVPENLEVPRKETPRLKVAKGSVGLASQQTGIYPQESPGGWNVIGKCPIPLFDPVRKPPCFISLGDKVRFQAVSEAEFNLHRIEAEVGVYDFKKKYGHAKG